MNHRWATTEALAGIRTERTEETVLWPEELVDNELSVELMRLPARGNHRPAIIHPRQADHKQTLDR